MIFFNFFLQLSSSVLFSFFFLNLKIAISFYILEVRFICHRLIYYLNDCPNTSNKKWLYFLNFICKGWNCKGDMGNSHVKGTNLKWIEKTRIILILNTNVVNENEFYPRFSHSYNFSVLFLNTPPLYSLPISWTFALVKHSLSHVWRLVNVTFFFLIRQFILST